MGVVVVVVLVILLELLGIRHMNPTSNILLLYIIRLAHLVWQPSVSVIVSVLYQVSKT